MDISHEPKDSIEKNIFNGMYYTPVVIRTEHQPMMKIIGTCNPEMDRYNQFVEQYNSQITCGNHVKFVW